MSSKRCRREPLPPIQLQCSPSLRSRHERRTRFGKHENSPKLIVEDEQMTCDRRRRWEDMDHEILIHIMKMYAWHEWGGINDFIVCKTWLSAFLDVLFPPGDVLDLRPLDDFANPLGFYYYSTRRSFYDWKIRKYFHYLKINLDRRTSNPYTKLVVSECILHTSFYSFLARRLPSVKSFVSPGKMRSNDKHFDFILKTKTYCYVSRSMFRHWSSNNLEDVHCHYSMIWDVAQYFKSSVRNLTLVGITGQRVWIRDCVALEIAGNFPLLDRLVISALILSFTAMSKILDGHKNLSYLDMTHSILVADDFPAQRSGYEVVLDYPWPKDLSHKIASVRTSLTCSGRGNCPNCIDIDSPSVV